MTRAVSPFEQHRCFPGRAGDGRVLRGSVAATPVHDAQSRRCGQTSRLPHPNATGWVHALDLLAPQLNAMDGKPEVKNRTPNLKIP